MTRPLILGGQSALRRTNNSNFKKEVWNRRGKLESFLMKSMINSK